MRVALATARNRQATGIDRYAREFTAALGELGVQTREIVIERREMKVGPVRVGGFASMWAQRMRASRGDADLLHALDPAVATRKADVVTIQDLLAEEFPQWFLSSRRARLDWALTRHAARRARWFVAPTDATRRQLIERWGVDAARIVVAPHGIDHKVFRPTPGDAPGLTDEKPTLVYVGDDNPRKNIGLIVSALASLKSRYGVDARFVRVGPSRFPAIHNAFRSEAAARGVDLVEAGYVGDTDLVRLLTGASAFVWPTLGEGFGFPPLEAMACGTPVVALDIPVNREVCGPTARYHPNDPAACADAIAATLRAPPSKDTVMAHARTFTWDAHARRVVRMYEEALR